MSGLWTALEVAAFLIGSAWAVLIVAFVLYIAWGVVRSRHAHWRSRADLFAYPGRNYASEGSRFDPV
jgi:hypothetical protein